jgi:hypothetical protein
LPVAADFSVAEVVGEDEDDIGSIGPGGFRDEEEEEGEPRDRALHGHTSNDATEENREPFGNASVAPNSVKDSNTLSIMRRYFSNRYKNDKNVVEIGLSACNFLFSRITEIFRHEKHD